MLALGGRASARPCGSAWLVGLATRGRGLKPADVAAGGKCKGRAQQGRAQPKGGGSSSLAPSRTLSHFSYS